MHLKSILLFLILEFLGSVKLRSRAVKLRSTAIKRSSNTVDPSLKLSAVLCSCHFEPRSWPLKRWSELNFNKSFHLRLKISGTDYVAYGQCDKLFVRPIIFQMPKNALWHAF